MKMAYIINEFKVLNDINNPAKGWIIKYKVVNVDLYSILFGFFGLMALAFSGFVFDNINKNIIIILAFFGYIFSGMIISDSDTIGKFFDSKDEAKEYVKELLAIKF